MIDRRLTEDCLMELTLLTSACLLFCEADVDYVGESVLVMCLLFCEAGSALMGIMLGSLCW